ncbi:hypothetical protein Marpi_0839 [Marinitoga piezophila KA3]|uniref:Uncharacterized protein n=1 Tax=Marinitoga piezophila (strain DSM 14283 / JCM 11233 / KA3) TaxID=443254 RepID=H2J6Z0_MARPK|nr:MULTISPECIES: hypothetical protein [Marinitoga]AEX85255.1 hypothetical protein Marpi_0839 [Marinitoga piezophila KA3]
MKIPQIIKLPEDILQYRKKDKVLLLSPEKAGAIVLNDIEYKIFCEFLN